MATLKIPIRKITAQAIKTIQSQKVKNEVIKYMQVLIDSKRDADGKSFPNKKESTKKAYRRMGWNETLWLVRTGESVKVVSKNIKNGVQFKPNDPAKILQYVKQSGEWFKLNSKEKTKVIKLILGDLYGKRLLSKK